MSTETKYLSFTPEVWGGVECTVNRVGNFYRDQLADAGHYQRDDDITQFALLGIKKLRYPVLWENHPVNENGGIDWHSTISRLENIRNENIIPIAGLLHHGSGPEHTNLLDAAFPEKLAAYAGLVALQFPWLEYYTPVNEPLTTARFSGLYGFWYPHHQNEKSFVLMLLNQVKGIILSMQAIRKINPAAKLVQTEDLCKVHSTPMLAYQACFENERRWLTYDLLCGLFKPGHAFWDHFLSLGIPEEGLSFFADNACPPDIIGFNYYITSERYLDEDLDNYPPHLHGGNGRHHYADTDAARKNKRFGLQLLLEEAWTRYHLPMAVTECHLNCTREEQLRWFKETWDACCQLNRKGIPVKAVTAWSLLGSYDWDSLLLRHNGHYEPGVFDISAGYLRPTLLAKMISTLASGQSFQHPLLANKGWWHSPENSIPGTASLVILNQDKDIAKDFENVCQQRKIYYHSFSSAVLLSDCNTPWGIVLTVRKWDDNSMTLRRSVIRYCYRHQIPLMIVSVSIVDIPKHNHLLIVYEPGGMKPAHHALDLFIDGEKGMWRLNREGAQKINIAEPALDYAMSE